MQAETHEIHELIAMVRELQRRVDALEGPEAGKRKGSLDQVLAAFTKAELPGTDAMWFFNHMEANGWKNNGKPVRSWQHCITAWKLAHIFPSQKANGNGHSVHSLKAILEAKETLARSLAAKHCHEDAFGRQWSNEPARQQFIALKKEIKEITTKIASS